MAPFLLEVRPSTKNIPDFLENPDNSSTPKNLIHPSVPDYFENPKKPIKLWYTQESQLPKCTRVLRQAKNSQPLKRLADYSS